MEFLLVAALISQFKISALLICTNEIYSSLEWTEQLPKSLFHQYVDSNEIISSNIHGNSHSTLTLCPKANFTGLPLSYFGQNTWLFEDHDVEDALPMLPLTLESNVLVASEQPGGGIVLQEHYAIKSQGKNVTFCTWDSKGGLKAIESAKSQWERRKDFSGVEIVVTVKQFPGLLVPVSETKLSGWFGEVIHLIQKELNFR